MKIRRDTEKYYARCTELATYPTANVTITPIMTHHVMGRASSATGISQR